MNKKGFTLTEILTVIVIIGLIIGIAVPSILAIRRKMNTRLYETKKETILSAAEIYAKDNKLEYDENNEDSITVNDLAEKNYVTIDLEQGTGACTDENWSNGCLTNPEDGRIINDDIIIIQKLDTSYNVEWGDDSSFLIVHFTVVGGSINGDTAKTETLKKGKSIEAMYSVYEDYIETGTTITCGSGIGVIDITNKKIIVTDIMENTTCNVRFRYNRANVRVTAIGGTVSPSNQLIPTDTDALLNLYPNNGFVYASNTCGGTINEGVMTIENVSDDINCNVTFVKQTEIFTYLSTPQTYRVPVTGTYKLEAFGSQGANYSSNNTGGLGGYISGKLNLNEGDILTIQTGGQDGTNGGGASTGSTSYNGGGATTIKINDTLLLIGAGGGGGSASGLGGEGGSGNSAGGDNVGNGPGTNGTNQGGGSSSRNITKDCDCSPCIKCRGTYECPNGGTTLSGKICYGAHIVNNIWRVESRYTVYNECTCNLYNGNWIHGGCDSVIPCADGYTKALQAKYCSTQTTALAGCQLCSIGIGSGITEFKQSAQDDCVWNGDYNATCSGEEYETQCCSRCTSSGKSGQGGTSSVQSVTELITKTDGHNAGNGQAIINYCPNGVC